MHKNSSHLDKEIRYRRPRDGRITGSMIFDNALCASLHSERNDGLKVWDGMRFRQH